MWIIPTNISDTFHFAVDTKELGLDSEEFSQTCERSLMWRSKPSQSPTWLRRWKRIKYLQHLSGRILKPSHTKSFLDKLTSSLGDSPANLFPMQEAEKELKTQDTSTPTSAMESEDVDQDLFSWKTLKESSVPKQREDEVFCSMSSKTWKQWVTSQRQEYSQRVKLAHLTKGKEFSSWGTPSTMDTLPPRSPEALARAKKKGGCKNLREDVVKNWPTPTVSEAEKIGGKPNYGQVGLSNHPKVHGYEVQREKLHKDRKRKKKKWPTPSARDHKGTNSIEHIMGNTASKRGHMGQLPNAILKDGLADQKNPNTTGKNQGQHLNPNWVEQLMGLPVGWTDLGSWETESYPKQ